MQEPGQKACCNWRARRPYVRPAYIHEVDRRYISENIERPIWQRPPSVLHETEPCVTNDSSEATLPFTKPSMSVAFASNASDLPAR
jgi:hypothetical protein